MTDLPASGSSHLPRRDFFLLPLLSLLTIALLLAGAELTSRHFFYGNEKDSCLVPDAKYGLKFRPNCTSRTKTNEGPWVTNHYNDCGYRTNESCGPKPAGTIRIALIGSSVAQGWNVQYDQTFATRSAVALAKLCNHPVQVQNLGRELCSIGCMYHHLDDALALQPDLIIVAVSPYDIETLLPQEVRDRDAPMHNAEAYTETKQQGLLIKRIQSDVTESRTVYVAEHFLFGNPTMYLQMYLNYGDKADFLRTPLSIAWQKRLQNVDILIGEMARKSAAAGVPLILIEVPNVPQIAAMSVPKPVPGLDAYALNAALQQIASRHNIDFVNVLDTFRSTPGSNKFFYLRAGHLDSNGSALITRPLVEQLTAGTHPDLPACGVPGQQNRLAQ